VLENLVAEIQKQGYKMDVGILGAKYVLNVLAENDRLDVAYQMLQQRAFPSYGYWVDQGATTLWEEWNGNQSHNHVMFGDVSAWFYKYLAGIKAAAPGFKQIVIKPNVIGDLTYASGSYDSAQGLIVSAWKRANSSLQLNVTIPANTSATVYVPLVSGKAVMESGKSLSTSGEIKFLRNEGNFSVLAVQPGSYHFTS
jgi:alpha-L-rhamnosidase